MSDTSPEYRPTYEELYEFAKDIQLRGLRHDLNPTVNFGVSVHEMYSNLTNYLRGADKSLRERAQRILSEEE